MLVIWDTSSMEPRDHVHNVHGKSHAYPITDVEWIQKRDLYKRVDVSKKRLFKHIGSE